MRCSPLPSAAAIATVCALLLVGCGVPAEPPQPSASATAGLCPSDELSLHTEGTLTIGTQAVAYPPWFTADDPANGKGYESALAYEIAGRMGYDTRHVTWVDTEFHQALADGAKPFDVYLNQVSFTRTRQDDVDLSSSYLDIHQAVITLEDSPIGTAQSLADLRAGVFGAVSESTSLQAAATIDSAGPTVAFPDNEKALAALEAGTIDGLVLDLPTALYFVGVRLKNAVLLGQLPNPDRSQPERLVALLEQGSPMTPCVSRIVDSLRSDGTLARLQKHWLYRSGPPRTLQ